MEIHKYVAKHNRLAFCEFMYNTIALQEGLIVKNPQELAGIVWRKDWKFEELEEGKLYHPVKDLQLHHKWRDRIFTLNHLD